MLLRLPSAERPTFTWSTIKAKSCPFLLGKLSVAPLKTVSVLRLELSAATVSLRRDKIVKRELDMPLNVDSVLWTDSMSVLRFVKNEKTRFHTFVAN